MKPDVTPVITALLDDTDRRMTAVIEALEHTLLTIRTGRLHPEILDTVKVDYHGTPTPVRHLATVRRT